MIQKAAVYYFKKKANTHARNILKSHLEQDAISEVLGNYWSRYKNEIPSLPEQETLGASLMIHLSSMSYAFYKSLLEKGLNPNEATVLYREIAWRTIKPMVKTMWKLSRLFKSNDYKRLHFLGFSALKFPFSEPDYQWERLTCDSPTVGFNCRKCPVANYYASKNLSEFCTQTWCYFDYAIAKEWNSNLERTGTIAGGAEFCDFRWKSQHP